jgi:predicted GIY-YIG superfamily endonuclease
MPCRVCQQIGHNVRTCPSHVSKKENIDVQEKKKVEASHYCYILQQVENPHLCNYVGYTVNFDRRIRQHNGIIKGGARFTKNRGPWEYLVVMTCGSWNNIRGLQVEWLVKHPTRKIKRPLCFRGSAGRIRSLVEIVKRIPATEAMTMYIHPAYLEMAKGLVFETPVQFISELRF